MSSQNGTKQDWYILRYKDLEYEAFVHESTNVGDRFAERSYTISHARSWYSVEAARGYVQFFPGTEVVKVYAEYKTLDDAGEV